MATLDRSSAIPIYVQLKEILREQAQGLAPDTRMPSELELVRYYQVSRPTAREALSRLVHEGVLYRLQGKGTYVAPARPPGRSAKIEAAARQAYSYLYYLDSCGALSRDEEPIIEALREALVWRDDEENEN